MATTGDKQTFIFSAAGKGKTKAEVYETTLRGWFSKKVKEFNLIIFIILTKICVHVLLTTTCACLVVCMHVAPSSSWREEQKAVAGIVRTFSVLVQL